jgi:hypothetical protein
MSPETLPDTCCLGAAAYGPERCTCWEPVLQPEQAPPQQGPCNVAKRMCSGCAFKPGLAESDPIVANVVDRSMRSQAFFCHHEVTAIVAWRHPAGFEKPAGPDRHTAPTNGWWGARADGRPAELCAGWMAAKRKQAKECAQ